MKKLCLTLAFSNQTVGSNPSNIFFLNMILVGELTPTRPRKQLLLLPVNINQPASSRMDTDTELKLKKIMRRNGILNINGQEYKTTVDNLEDLGELGNGTSGHVVKMKHRPSGTIIAVKVCN